MQRNIKSGAIYFKYKAYYLLHITVRVAILFFSKINIESDVSLEISTYSKYLQV